MIPKLIWRNLWRNSRRTLITMASIAFAVLLSVLMQSFQTGVFKNLIKNVVSYYTGYIQIHQKGYWEEQILDNSFETQEDFFSAIRADAAIKAIVPRIETFVLASNQNTSKGCMLVGTDVIGEDNLTQLKSRLSGGQYLRENENAVLVAEGLARRLNLRVNDTLVLFGQGYHEVMAAGKFKIKGLLHLASPAMNDAFVYMPLSAAQFFLSAENRVTSVSLGIGNPENLPAITSRLRKATGPRYETMTWQEMMPDIANHIRADGFTLYIFLGILYLIIGFGLFGTVLMMTMERQYEFGMLIAIGMKKSKLEQILFGETIVITIFGVIGGILLSLPIVYRLKKNPLRLGGEVAKGYEQFGFEAIFPTDTSGSIFMTQSLIVLVMAALIGWSPIWQVKNLNPVKAMKK